jgi:hypothetical protein
MTLLKEGRIIVNFNVDMHTWLQFLQDKWWVLALVLIALLFVIRVVTTVVKWVIVVAIVTGVIVYSGYTLDDVTALGTKVASNMKDQAVVAMTDEAKSATFKANKDGSFTVKSKSIQLKGKTGAKEVEVFFKDSLIGTWEIDETIQTLINTAKSNK